MHIEKLTLYPVKSMAGYDVPSAFCDENGLEGDRRFVVTRPDGKFITARQYPKLLTLQPRWVDGFDRLEIKGPAGTLHVSAHPGEDESAPVPVTVWNDTILSGDCGEDAANWISEFLGREARLKTLAENSSRQSDGNPFVPASYADAMPLLVLSDASVEDMNSRLDSPVTVRNFRPNIYVSGVSSPFDEDYWSSFRAEDVEITIVYGCSRCVMTTADPETGVFRKDKEPMKMLGSYRRGPDKQIYVGQNAAVSRAGVLRAGAEIILGPRRDTPVYSL
ncbi:hypothetical protein GCM10017044_01170 [Kordiimonas sediminis]|uniref:MOSC domain-containing protein n=1 Tax=Kordiimonas sediminis TaxID=1735581 RepID=A0A919E4F5_9PROT|nr:MOSC N-terminal beta barrel domain-containing protein [Kordiimonas sediminis]GHF11213.1 hypothetical protein GCM10017044_01170 [Kordiimonas sediminis]